MSHKNTEVDIISRIGLYMSGERELRKGIVVQGTDLYNWDDMLADFCSKEEILDKNFSNTFNYRKTQGYYAGFLVQGLRIKDKDAFKCFLFYIFILEMAIGEKKRFDLGLTQMVKQVGR